MWLWLLLILVAIIAIKLINLSLFWSKYDLPTESLSRSLYRMLWLFNMKPIFEVLRQDVKTYGPMYASFWGFTPALMLTDVEVAKDVLIKQFGKKFFKRSFEFESGDPLWDNTLTQLPYEKWKAVRTIMGYCFTSSKMKGMSPKLDRVATRLVDKLEKISKTPENEIELNKYLRGYSMDSIVAISFGLELDCIENPNHDFVKNATDLFKPGLVTTLALLVPQLLKYIPFIRFPRKETSKFFGELGRHILKEKRRNLDEVIKNKTADILDLHLIAQREESENSISDEVLASQAFVFFIAGLDATGLTLDMTAYYLAVNPDVQERVYEEIKNVMGDRTQVSFEDLQKMKLLEASILETLRFFPFGLVVDRICAEDTEVAGVEIKKGTMVIFNLPYMHMDPAYFPEPDKYMPERFLKNGEVSSETAAFLSFGDGPKGCIGRRLAIVIMQMILAKILLKLRLERCAATPYPFELKAGMDVNNMSKHPLVLKLVDRE